MTNLTERAFQLAGTGVYGTPSEIAKQLKTEGFETRLIAAVFDGLSLKRQILAICRAARAA